MRKKRASKGRRKGQVRQGYLAWMKQHEGGKLGRKPSASSGPSHQAREEFDPRHPLHVTVKVVEGLPSLRGIKEFHVIREAMRAGCERAGRLADGVFRLVHFSVQGNQSIGSSRRAIARASRAASAA